MPVAFVVGRLVLHRRNTHAILYKCGGVRRQGTEDQVCIYLHLQAEQTDGYHSIATKSATIYDNFVCFCFNFHEENKIEALSTLFQKAFKKILSPSLNQ